MPKRTRKNKKYSAELKLQAVQTYLNSEGGLWAVCKKHGILNEKQLRNWSKWYNGHRIMRILGLKSVIRRKRPDYVKSTPEITAENVLNRDFKATVPFEKWLTDVTNLNITLDPR